MRLIAGIALAMGLVLLLVRHSGLPRRGTDHTAPEEGNLIESSCTNPYVPRSLGEVREYRWESPRGTGMIRGELIARDDVAGHARFRWGFDSPEHVESWSRCDGEEAQEPWLALGGSTALQLGDPTWRLPSRLDVGDAYAGEVTATAFGLHVTLRRSHRVVARETVRAAGLRFETVRIEVEERTDRAAEAVTSTQWLAPAVGLVQMWVGPESDRTSVVLTSMEHGVGSRGR
jgi:hypothetical protein